VKEEYKPEQKELGAKENWLVNKREKRMLKG
jgi:hypothetical protein